MSLCETTEPVLVTGMGVAAVGAGDLAQFWKVAAEGKDQATLWEIEAGDKSLKLGAARICEDVTTASSGMKRGHRLDRSVQLGLLAADRAVRNAGLATRLAEAEEGSDGLAVIVGTSRGPVGRFSEGMLAGMKKGRVLPSFAAESTPASLSGAIGAKFGAGALCYTLSSACSAGAHAICLAAEHLRAGCAGIAIAGGADAPLLPFLARQFQSTGILDPTLPPDAVCKPFDLRAGGTLLGEGAGFLVLETESHAKARGANALARLHGWGMAADGRSASPESAGAQALRRSSAKALRHAGLRASDIGYINLHGTGTLLNDAMELSWMQDFQRDAGGRVLYGSTKPVTGHCLGATSAMEAVLCVLCLQHGLALPSANCSSPSQAAPAGLVIAKPRPLPTGFVMTTSVGFWGAGATLIFSL